MLHHVILTGIGADRPGLVDEISRYVFERGGNVEDSRMVNLRGQFAIMMLVGGNESALAKINSETEMLARESKLHVEAHPAAAGRTSASADAMPYRLTATAMDQSGLMHRVSHLLRELNVNIESAQTSLTAAPITGAPTFGMILTVSVPRATSITKLRDALGKLCDELNIDWQLAAM
jgi:glycine cleavage system transcriptional repressor